MSEAELREAVARRLGHPTVWGSLDQLSREPGWEISLPHLRQHLRAVAEEEMTKADSIIALVRAHDVEQVEPAHLEHG